MNLLQWVYIIGVAFTIINFIFFVLNLGLYFLSRRQEKALQEIKKSRSKRKRKAQRKKHKLLVEKKKKSFRNGLIFLSLFGLFAAGSYFVTYYQATNLSAEDTQNLTDGYYYVRDLQEEVEHIKDGTPSEDRETLTYIASSLASYTLKRASTLNTVEGQAVLNRYYNGLAELGLNVSKQQTLLYEDEKIVAEILEDIDKVQRYQKKAIEFYKIDESVLKSQK